MKRLSVLIFSYPMSKTTVKKALQNLDKDQIIEMILDLHSDRPEAREYLEFWVSGDIDSKMNKAKAAIVKEVSRRQRTRPRPRMTKIKRYIKDIVRLNADAESIAEIMTFAVEKMCIAGSEGWIKESTQKSTAKLLHDTLVYAAKNGEYGITNGKLNEAIKNMRNDVWWSRDFKKMLYEELYDTDKVLNS